MSDQYLLYITCPKGYEYGYYSFHMPDIKTAKRERTRLQRIATLVSAGRRDGYDEIDVGPERYVIEAKDIGSPILIYKAVDA